MHWGENEFVQREIDNAAMARLPIGDESIFRFFPIIFSLLLLIYKLALKCDYVGFHAKVEDFSSPTII